MHENDVNDKNNMFFLVCFVYRTEMNRMEANSQYLKDGSSVRTTPAPMLTMISNVSADEYIQTKLKTHERYITYTNLAHH